jgi:hypothetical protein
MPEPRHDVICEPYAGGAAYALRHSEHEVVLCEREKNLVELWPWLIREATEHDVRDIPVGVPVGTDIRTLGLSQGQALLLKTWQRTNNVGDCWTISPWGDRPGQWTQSTRARVAEEVGAVKHWRFCDDVDGMDLIETLDLDATWFVDPPYQHNYGYGQPPIDYARLATALLVRRDHVIVCEAVCKKTGQTPGWLPFASFGSRVTSRRGKDSLGRSHELLWENA